MGPLVASSGTRARMRVDSTRVKLAFTPLNVTAVAPVKFAPLIVTLAPSAPFVGVKLAMVGAIVKGVSLVVVPAGVVTPRGSEPGGSD